MRTEFHHIPEGPKAKKPDRLPGLNIQVAGWEKTVSELEAKFKKEKNPAIRNKLDGNLLYARGMLKEVSGDRNREVAKQKPQTPEPGSLSATSRDIKKHFLDRKRWSAEPDLDDE